MLELLLISHHGRVALLCALNKVMLSLLFNSLSSLIYTPPRFDTLVGCYRRFNCISAEEIHYRSSFQQALVNGQSLQTVQGQT